MAAVGEARGQPSHEVGNPLAAISGSRCSCSRFDRRRKAGTPAARHHRQGASASTGRSRGFLRFARRAGAPRPDSSICRPAAENTALLRNSRGGRRVGTSSPSSSTPVRPSSPATRIRSARSSGIWPATPYAQCQGGKLHIQGTLKWRFLRHRFATPAMVMSEEQRAKLFHPFQSFFRHRYRHGRRLPHRPGARRLDQRREPGGAGTRIVVSLPHPRSRGAWQRRAWKVPSGSILIVDDETSLLAEFRSRIAFASARGLSVTTARSRPGVAREQLAERTPDLVLCDVMMPDGNGLERPARDPGRRVADFGQMHDDRRRPRRLKGAYGATSWARTTVFPSRSTSR